MDTGTLRHIFSTRLKLAISHSGSNQKELADMMGVRRATVNDWCNGRTFPGFDTVDEIAETLNVSSSWFFAGESSDLASKKNELIEYVSSSKNEPLIEALINIVNNAQDINLLKDMLERFYFPAVEKNKESSQDKKEA